MARKKSNNAPEKRNNVKSDSRRRENRRAEVIQPHTTIKLPKKNKKIGKREKSRRARDMTDLPNMDELVSEEARRLRVGFGILEFTSPFGEPEQDLSSDDTSITEISVSPAKDSLATDIESKDTSTKDANNTPADVFVDKSLANGSANKEPYAKSLSNSTNASTEEDFISLEGLSDSDSGEEEGFFQSRGQISNSSTMRVDPSAPWWTKVDTTIGSGSELIATELLEYLRYVSPHPIETNRRLATISRLRRTVNHMWRSARVCVFGSQATGMYLPEADIDVVILCDEMKAKIRQDMYRLAAGLRKGRLTEDIQVVSHARVPIIKYVENGSRHNVDIAFGQTGGLSTAKLVISWLNEFPVLKPMGMFVRQFLKQRKLSDVANGGLGGYAMICMMYSRLQQVISQFPSVFGASEIKEESDITILQNCGLLLIDFFDYYGNEFDNAMQAVRCVSPYTPFNKRLNSDMATPQSVGLAIEDPQCRQNNISRASYNYPTVKRSFQNAADVLKAMLLARHKEGVKALAFQSMLGPLLKYRGQGDIREKSDLADALRVPKLDSDALAEISSPPSSPAQRSAPPETRSKKASRRDALNDSRLDSPKQDSKKVEKSPGFTRKERRAVQAATASAASKASKPSPTPSKRSPDFDPWDSNPGPNAKVTKLRPKSPSREESSAPTIEDNNDDFDSRVKLTTAERRQFWQGKGLADV